MFKIFEWNSLLLNYSSYLFLGPIRTSRSISESELADRWSTDYLMFFALKLASSLSTEQLKV